MPLQTDFNVAPYFDDFNEDKKYYRILFRPSIALQARELTQLQATIQNQIERFGNHIFKNGDIVSGCSIKDMNPMPFVRLADVNSNNQSFDISLVANTLAVSATSNLSARVIISKAGLTTQYPNTNVVYLQYINTGNGGETVFANNESLTFFTIPRTGDDAADTVLVANTFASNSTTVTSGNAHGISVTDGIVYLSGYFVKLEPTVGVVKAFDVDAGNNVVGFALTEDIVTEDEDEDLLDNALGYSNENAPGAHRVKLTAELVSLTQAEAANTSGFNPIATYNYGALVTRNSTTDPYNAVGEVLAKRTYEESGNYVVNPFVVDTVSSNSSSSYMLTRVNPGVGYAEGHRVEIEQTAYVDTRRAVDQASSQQQQITFNYGNYIQVDEVAGIFDFDSLQTVTLYDAPQQAVTNRNWATITPTGNVIGTAKARMFTYASGQPGTRDAIYNIHLFNITMNTGYAFNQVRSVYYNGATKGIADLVTYQLKDASDKRLLFTFGARGLKSLRNAANNNNSEYVYRKKSTGILAVDGTATVTLTTSSPGGTDILPYGLGNLTDADSSELSVVITANAQSAALSGTVQIFNNSANVIGTSTTFLSSFANGEVIKVGSDFRKIETVSNNTFMTVDNAFSSSLSGQSYVKYYPAGWVVPLYESLPGNRYVEVANTTSFTVHTGASLSGTVGVTIYHNVLRTITTPASKIINKNRFVKIDTASNPKGPWCLGLTDVHQLRKVYAGSTYDTSNVDMTSSFVFDSGQRDTHYGLAYLYPKAGVSLGTNSKLLVQLDYFTANNSAGVGFFTVESYPIDDANTANTSAITTAHLPLYVDESGNKLPLRDYVDFRPQANNTAVDTGAVDTANTTQVATAVGLATANPANTEVIKIPSGGLNTPSPGSNFQADYTYYLPRKDLFYITPSTRLKIKEGASARAPQTPLYPDNGMPVAVLNIPAYPSLTSDQMDELAAINATSKTMVRNTLESVMTTIVTNRKYTMRDIGALDQRIGNLEYYAALSLLEKQAADLMVTDENGLDRFKNGIFVEPFSNHQLGDVSNPEYKIAIDSRKGVGRPFIVRELVNLKFNTITSSNVMKTGRAITLSYTHTPYVTQPYATKFRNAAPAAFRWNGTAQLAPPFSNHVDTNNTGSIQINQDNTQAWREFAASPFGTVFGDWQTTVNRTATTQIVDDFGGVTTPTTPTVQNRGNGTLIEVARGPNGQAWTNSLTTDADWNIRYVAGGSVAATSQVVRGNVIVSR